MLCAAYIKYCDTNKRENNDETFNPKPDSLVQHFADAYTTTDVQSLYVSYERNSVAQSAAESLANSLCKLGKVDQMLGLEIAYDYELRVISGKEH